jgi:hypothetical protein
MADEPITASVRRRRHRDVAGRRGDGLGRGRDGDVLRQVEVHRAHRLGHGERDGSAHRLRDASALQPQRRLGDRLEQGVVVDPHLDAAAEQVGVEIAGDGDHR